MAAVGAVFRDGRRGFVSAVARVCLVVALPVRVGAVVTVGGQGVAAASPSSSAGESGVWR